MASPTVNWPAGAGIDLPAHGEVHIWAVSLAQPPGTVNTLEQLLTAEEQARAQAFKFPRLRERYIAGRGQLRRLLGQYLKLNPERVEFDYTPRGKPSLKPGSGAEGCHFNVAHSDELALIAISTTAPVGVDVELIRPMPDAEGIAERFFSPRELAALRSVALAARDAAFFRLWTRKEAWLKATGDGIAESLAKIEVAFLAEEPPRVLAVAGDPLAADAWSLCHLQPAAGFVGALATRCRPVRLQCWRVVG